MGTRWPGSLASCIARRSRRYRPDGVRRLRRAASRSGIDELPLAATYVIDTGGVIRFAFLDADYSRRAKPQAVIEALGRLKPRAPAAAPSSTPGATAPESRTASVR